MSIKIPILDQTFDVAGTNTYKDYQIKCNSNLIINNISYTPSYYLTYRVIFTSRGTIDIYLLFDYIKNTFYSIKYKFRFSTMLKIAELGYDTVNSLYPTKAVKTGLTNNIPLFSLVENKFTFVSPNPELSYEVTFDSIIENINIYTNKSNSINLNFYADDLKVGLVANIKNSENINGTLVEEMTGDNIVSVSQSLDYNSSFVGNSGININPYDIRFFYLYNLNIIQYKPKKLKTLFCKLLNSNIVATNGVENTTKNFIDCQNKNIGAVLCTNPDLCTNVYYNNPNPRSGSACIDSKTGTIINISCDQLYNNGKNNCNTKSNGCNINCNNNINNCITNCNNKCINNSNNKCEKDKCEKDKCEKDKCEKDKSKKDKSKKNKSTYSLSNFFNNFFSGNYKDIKSKHKHKDNKNKCKCESKTNCKCNVKNNECEGNGCDIGNFIKDFFNSDKNILLVIKKI